MPVQEKLVSFCLFVSSQLEDRYDVSIASKTTKSALLLPFNTFDDHINAPLNQSQSQLFFICILIKVEKVQHVGWKVTLSLGGNIFPQPGGADTKRTMVRAGCSLADGHKYPCKLQFKRNQYVTSCQCHYLGCNEGVLAGVGGNR